jgi:hypothetical protein
MFCFSTPHARMRVQNTGVENSFLTKVPRPVKIFLTNLTLRYIESDTFSVRIPVEIRTRYE